MTTHSDNRESLGTLIGRNAQRRREETDVSRDELARMARQLTGAAWTASRVGTIETGHTTPGLPTLLTYCTVLNFARMVNHLDPIGLPDFFEGTVDVAIAEGFTLSSTNVKAAFAGAPVIAEGQATTIDEIVENMVAVVDTMHEAIPSNVRLPAKYRNKKSKTGLAMLAKSHIIGGGDKRAAKSLGWDIVEIVAWSKLLWGKTFSQERDQRAGVGASAQKRGKISRDLMDELKAAYEAED